MHKPPPLVLPESSASLSARCVWRPANSIALSGQLLFNHVSVKNMTFESIIRLLLVMESRISSILFARERTLARKILGKGSRCGVSFSLARSPPRLPRLCLCSAPSACTSARQGRVGSLRCSGDLWDESEIGDKTVGVMSPDVQKLLSAVGQQRTAILDE